jgi:CheY-like chemotaxis protein
MNGIIGMTELALATPLNPKQTSYLNIVRQSSDSLLRLLNDILDFSKVEAGKLELESISFDLRDVVGEALQIRARCASEKGIELIHRVSGDVPLAVVGDPGRLRQILVNLVGNSVKFTDQGEIIVDVGVEACSADRARLHFAVQDTGIGIPADKLGCIFESFQQADTSTTRKYGGTGLGLAICQQLVHLMNGEIWVESELGSGSVFHFTAEFDVIKAGNGCEELPTAPQLSGLRTLLVDDHRQSREAACEYLSCAGAEVTGVDNSAEALAMLHRASLAGKEYQFVLIDAAMPNEDGWALLEELRRDPALQPCRVSMLLPPVEQSERIGASDFSDVHCLPKPAKYSELIEAARLALRSMENGDVAMTERKELEPQRAMDVLLVEDGIVNQQVATGLLELIGHHVQVAGNGLEALDKIAEHTFDVVLMDLEMPEMDGLTATTEIRKRELGTGRRVPIFAMTAHAVKGFAEKCADAGMDGYVTKPIWPDDLTKALELAARLGTERPATVSA